MPPPFAEAPERFHGQANREAYQLAIGKVVWAWTEYHEALADLYASLHSREEWSRSLGDWHDERDDHRARQKLSKAANDTLPAGDRARGEINWIIETTDKVLRDNRNIAAHMPLMSYTDEHGTHQILPMTLLGNPRALQMDGRDVLAEYGLLDTRIRKMTTFAMIVGTILRDRNDQANDWPERPRL